MTVDFDATQTPQNVGQAAALVTGRTYSIQNVSDDVEVLIREAPTAPAATARGFRVKPGDSGVLSPGVDPIWIWTRTSGAACIITEAV